MANLAHSLTHRDFEILSMAYSYQGIAVDHIKTRFFPISIASSSCYRRVAHLVKGGFLQSTRLPSQSGVGSGRMFLTLGPAARPILAQMLGLSRSELARSRMDSPSFISHHLALCDTRLAFEMACQQSAWFTLQDWIGDGQLRQSPLKVKDPDTNRELPIVPDATFTLALTNGMEQAQAFALEMDMGTLAPKRMQIKLRAYLLPREDPTPVLFIVPDLHRQAAILRWALEQAGELAADPTIFWVTTKELLTPDTVLASPIWQVVAGPEALALESLAREPWQPNGELTFASVHATNGQGGLLP